MISYLDYFSTSYEIATRSLFVECNLHYSNIAANCDICLPDVIIFLTKKNNEETSALKKRIEYIHSWLVSDVCEIEIDIHGEINEVDNSIVNQLETFLVFYSQCYPTIGHKQLMKIKTPLHASISSLPTHCECIQSAISPPLFRES